MRAGRATELGADPHNTLLEREDAEGNGYVAAVDEDIETVPVCLSAHFGRGGKGRRGAERQAGDHREESKVSHGHCDTSHVSTGPMPGRAENGGADPSCQ